jgi:hypothetical protein
MRKINEETPNRHLSTVPQRDLPSSEDRYCSHRSYRIYTSRKKDSGISTSPQELDNVIADKKELEIQDELEKRALIDQSSWNSKPWRDVFSKKASDRPSLRQSYDLNRNLEHC